MKNLFKYEINESIAAKAAMNCLKNRNTHKIQEQEEGTDDKETFAHKLVKKFKNKMTPDYAKRPEMFMMLKLQKAIKKPLMSLSKEEYQAWAKAICNACESVFGSAQEQEETDYTNDEIPSPNFSYRMSFMVWAMRNIIPYLKETSQVCAQADPTELKHAVMKILKTRDTGTPETPRSCKEWAKENYDWVEMELNGEYDDYQKKWSKPFNITPSITSEQEEMPEMERDDIKHVLTQYLDECWIDASEDGDLEDLYYAVSDYLDSTGDYPASTSWQDCKPWCQKHYQEIENLFLGGSFYQEQEEMPKMEQNDIKQALTQYLDEVWIDASEDGDLEDLYYAVSDYLDSTGDYPASAEWEDCKPWCQKHYQEIENLFLGGSLS
jgi:hypothetical protein